MKASKFVCSVPLILGHPVALIIAVYRATRIWLSGGCTPASYYVITESIPRWNPLKVYLVQDILTYPECATNLLQLYSLDHFNFGSKS